MAFGTAGGSRSQARGPSLGFRFTLYAILSFVIMFLDQRHGWMEQARYVLQAGAYPIQRAVSSPSAAWGWMRESFASRETLQAENARLKKQQHELELRAMRYDALARENGELRGLRDALPPVADRWLAAEIVNIQADSLRQRILINRGSANGAFKAQAVLDDKGVIGQTTHIGPWSAEVILITDPEHAIPVVIERTGLRTIAVGAGDNVSMALPYLPGNADVKPGDQLVTSGLGGVFPAGYPVARITEVHRDAVQPLALVKALPFANVESDSEVVLVWFREDHPAAPTAAGTGDLKVGNKSLQPQAAPPPRPKAPPPAAQPETPGPGTNTPPPAPNTSGDSRNPTTGTGTVNPAANPASKGGTPSAPPGPAARANSTGSSAGEATPAPANNPTTSRPGPSPKPPSDAAPRNP